MPLFSNKRLNKEKIMLTLLQKVTVIGIQKTKFEGSGFFVKCYVQLF